MVRREVQVRRPADTRSSSRGEVYTHEGAGNIALPVDDDAVAREARRSGLVEEVGDGNEELFAAVAVRVSERWRGEHVRIH